MPIIKTKDWLREALKQNNMTQKELAEKSGLSLPSISKILAGERHGSVETWKKISRVLPDTDTARGSILDRLEQDIFAYGASRDVIVYYTDNNGQIVFDDYSFDRDNDKSSRCSLHTSLKDALMLFTCQSHKSS